jgi:thymidylate kinase
VLPQETKAPPEGKQSAGSLLQRLATALESSGVKYCQWKGHWSGHRWSTGFGDVDLLVARGELSRFRALVGELGFKPAQPQGHRIIPGVESYFGYDPAVPRLLHLHVHYQLVLGDYWKPVYRIPFERELLDRSVPGRLFRIPAPTDQFLVFVLRLMLRQVGRPLLSLQTRWTSGVQIQLDSLEAGSNREELAALLKRHLNLDCSVFDRCVRSLRGECGTLERAILPWLMHRQLRAHARRPPAAAVLSAAAEKLVAALGQGGRRAHLSDGGAVFALIGGDGAGNSTCARELVRWLEPAFPTMPADLENPPRSLTTLVVGAALELQHRIARRLKRPNRAGELIELLRHLCTARDRHRLYLRVQRFAAAGGIAICEGYPIEQNRALVGPAIPGLLTGQIGPAAAWVRRVEVAYYQRILRPDAICVLRLDPELAVQRNPNEPADSVRARSRIIWETDWRLTGAHVVDTSRPLPEILQRLKALLWSIL